MQPTEFQSTPNDMLIDAARDGDIERVRVLLHDAAVAQPARDYALDEAAEKGHVGLVQMLLANGADPGAHGGFPLSHAAANGHVGVVQLLLANGADPAADDSCALRWAADRGYVEIARLLLAEGADPAAHNDFAIRFAAQNGHAEVVRLLLVDGRANPDAFDNYAIHAAAHCGHLPVVQLLLAAATTQSTRSLLAKQRLEQRALAASIHAYLKSYECEPRVAEMIESLHVLLQLRLPDLTAEGMFALVDAFAKMHVSSQMLRELHQQGQLLPFLQGALDPQVTIPSLDVTKGQERDLARLARVSKEPPLGHVSSIPEILYALAPSLPARMVDRLWEMLRSHVRDGKEFGHLVAQRERGTQQHPHKRRRYWALARASGVVKTLTGDEVS
jgi:ankyrin repeat protein